MSSLSTLQIKRSDFTFGGLASDFHPEYVWTGPALRQSSSTAIVDKSACDETSTATKKKEYVPPAPQFVLDRSEAIDATVIQLWEGRVLEVDFENKVMQVFLTAKLGKMPEHTAEIELQWVSEQDRDLLVAGAVFYLTLYKQTRRGSIQNAQELRFRRRPAWTKSQVEKIHKDAALILGKMRSRPIAA